VRADAAAAHELFLNDLGSGVGGSVLRTRWTRTARRSLRTLSRSSECPDAARRAADRAPCRRLETVAGAPAGRVVL